MPILTKVLSNRSQLVMVDGYQSKLVNIVLDKPPGSAVSLILFLLYTVYLGAFFILTNQLLSYADESTLLDVVPSPGIRTVVAEFLINDLGKVSEWCGIWVIKFYMHMSKTMVVSGHVQCITSQLSPQTEL